MPLDVIVGGQWGDEGKGKVSASLSRGAYGAARFQGGPNAGHTAFLEDGAPFEFHMLPAGSVSAHRSFIGHGVLVDLGVLLREVRELERRGHAGRASVAVSLDAHVITQAHKVEDLGALSQRIGTTRKGVGPAVASKVRREGVRVREVLSDMRILTSAQDREEAAQFIDALGDRCVDVGQQLRDAMDRGDTVIAEAGQGSALDLDNGDYPFVTSTHTTVGGAFIGLGVAPRHLGRVTIVASSYCTKLGAGAFPTKGDAAEGAALFEAGDEFDHHRGEPRVCGWHDLAQTRRSVQINGGDQIVLTKLDVLGQLPYFRVMDSEHGTDIVAEGWAGWNQWTDPPSAWPAQVLQFLERVADGCGAPVTAISVGRDQRELVELAPALGGAGGART